jgi:hypothetical protein
LLPLERLLQMVPESHPLVLPGVLHALPTPPPSSSPPPQPTTTASRSAARTHRITRFLLLSDTLTLTAAFGSFNWYQYFFFASSGHLACNIRLFSSLDNFILYPLYLLSL